MKEYVLGEYANALSGFHMKTVLDFSRSKTPHFHDYYQLYYVRQGEIVHFVQGASAKLCAGDVAFVAPLTEHHVEENRDAELYSLSFRPSFLPKEQSGGFLGEYLLALRGGTGREQPRLNLSNLPAEETGRIVILFDMLWTEFTRHEPAYVSALQGLLAALLCILARTGQSRADAFEKGNGFEEKRLRILQCTDRMRLNLAVPVRIEDAAHSCMMSRAQFCKVFLEVTGASFAKYRTRVRIDYAAGLLREDTRPLEEIARLCGFEEYSSFYRNFVDRIGISPNRYRQLSCDRRTPYQE